MLHVAQLIICHPKSKIYEHLRKFSNSYSQEQTEHVYCHFFEFLHNILYYLQRHNQSPIKDLRCTFWRQQLTVPKAYSKQSGTSKMMLFEKNIFSCQLIQPFTIYIKSPNLDVPICSEYASGTINYFHNRLHLDVWLGSRYTSDMFKERRKLQKTCKGVIFRNAAAKTKA